MAIPLQVTAWKDQLSGGTTFLSSDSARLKYEEVYLHAYDSVSSAQAHIERHLTPLQHGPPHSSFADQTHDEE